MRPRFEIQTVAGFGAAANARAEFQVIVFDHLAGTTVHHERIVKRDSEDVSGWRDRVAAAVESGSAVAETYERECVT
jgi:hypothetical protein